MAMDCLKSFRSCAAMIVLLTCWRSVQAQESTATLNVILQRLERVERDNERLRQLVSSFDSQNSPQTAKDSLPKRGPESALSEVDADSESWIYQPVEPQTLFGSSERAPLLTDGDVRSVVHEAVDQQSGQSSALPGAYVQAGYFLTGEHRPYDRNTGTIDRVIPKSNLAFDGKTCAPGLGAWEVAGRWSYLDLNDAAIRGGNIMDYTVGINWYWNPYTKMVFNYVHAISNPVGSPQAQTDMFGVRAQIDF